MQTFQNNGFLDDSRNIHFRLPQKVGEPMQDETVERECSERELVASLIKPNVLADLCRSIPDSNIIGNLLRYILGQDVELSAIEKALFDAVSADAKRLVEYKNAEIERVKKYKQKKKLAAESSQKAEVSSPDEPVEPPQQNKPEKPKGEERSGREQFDHVTGFHPGRPTADDVKKFYSGRKDVQKEDLDAITEFAMQWFEDANWKNGKGEVISLMNFKTTISRMIPGFYQRRKIMESVTPKNEPSVDDINTAWSNFYKVECDD